MGSAGLKDSTLELLADATNRGANFFEGLAQYHLPVAGTRWRCKSDLRGGLELAN